MLGGKSTSCKNIFKRSEDLKIISIKSSGPPIVEYKNGVD
jgi:hypothetical protein